MLQAVKSEASTSRVGLSSVRTDFSGFAGSGVFKLVDMGITVLGASPGSSSRRMNGLFAGVVTCSLKTPDFTRMRWGLAAVAPEVTAAIADRTVVWVPEPSNAATAS